MFLRINKQIPIDDSNELDLFLFHRKMSRILYKFTAYLVVPLLFIGSYLYFSTGFFLFGILEILTGLILIFVTYLKYIEYKIKTQIILFIYYLSALFVLITTGVNGGGFISLCVTTMFFGFLQRRKGFNWTFFLVNTGVLSVLSYLLFNGHLDSFKIITYKETWFFIITLLTMYSIGILSTISYYKQSIIHQITVSEQKRVFLDNLVNTVDSFIVTIDNHRTITMTNQPFDQLFSEGKSLVGHNYDDVLNSFLKKNTCDSSCDKSLLDNELTDGDFCITREDKTIYFNRKVLDLHYDQNNTEKLIILRDITERKENEEKLNYLSYKDQLTGLYNRRFHEIELERLDTQRSLPLTMIMIDVNGLKLINDSFGHNYGDKVLIQTANVISSCCRDNDIVSRIGGDEFLIILPNVSKKSAEHLASRLTEAAKNISIEGIQLSFSIGIGTKETETESIRDIFTIMEDELYRNKLWESQSMRSKTIDLVLQTLYEKNNREMMHSKRVSTLSEDLAKALNLSETQVEEIKLAGLMHDIGKIGIEETILNKPGRLDEQEWDKMKQHSEIGYRILNSVGEFSNISQIVLHHHENYNGTGYPSGEKGKDIMLGARIIRIADSYDAMTGERTYNTPLRKEHAVQELIKNSNTMFDKELVDLFVNKVIN